MQIIIFQRKTNKALLKTLQILDLQLYGRGVVPNIGIFDPKLKVFHGFN